MYFWLNLQKEQKKFEKQKKKEKKIFFFLNIEPDRLNRSDPRFAVEPVEPAGPVWFLKHCK